MISLARHRDEELGRVDEDGFLTNRSRRTRDLESITTAGSQLVVHVRQWIISAGTRNRNRFATVRHDLSILAARVHEPDGLTIGGGIGIFTAAFSPVFPPSAAGETFN